jgi:hypothetical protein
MKRHERGKRHSILKKAYAKSPLVVERELGVEDPFIEAYALGNEVSHQGYSHCHGLFKTKVKLTFEEFKDQFYANVTKGVEICDI